MIFKSWAPGFPGFYETIWAPNPDMEYDLIEINSIRENNGLLQIHNPNYLHYDYEKYEENISNEYCKVLNKIFKKEGF